MMIEIKVLPGKPDKDGLHEAVLDAKSGRVLQDGKPLEYVVIDGDRIPLSDLEGLELVSHDQEQLRALVDAAEIKNGKIAIFADLSECYDDLLKGLAQGSSVRMYIIAEEQQEAPEPAPKKAPKKEEKAND